MTSWPWMKGIDFAVAAPIAPVCNEDERYAVVDLLKQHRATIDEIKSIIKSDPLYDSTKHDDLWILRFVLSHKGKIKKVVKAAKHTLQLRKKYNLDDQDIRDHPPYAALWDDVKIWYKFAKGNTRHTIPDKQRGVIVYINPKGMDFHGLDANLDDKKIFSAHVYIMEWTYQWLDYVTRTTGRLTKSIRIVDLNDTGRDAIHMRYNKRYSAIVDHMEDTYPQLLESAFACNPASWMKLLWDVIRPLLPKRVVSKVDMIAPAQNNKERQRLFKHISEDDLPQMFGGNNIIPYQQLV